MPCKGTLAGAERPSRLRVSRLPSAAQHKTQGGTAQAHCTGPYQPSQIALLATLATARQNRGYQTAIKRCQTPANAAQLLYFSMVLFICWQAGRDCVRRDKACCMPKSLFKAFPCVRKRNKWPGVATHTAARAARCGKECNKEHAHWLPCPRSCCCKRQHLPCCQYLPGRQPARFCSVFRVPCSVLRALRLATTAFAKQGTQCEAF